MPAYETKAWLDAYSSWTDAELDYGTTTLLDVYDNNLAKNPGKPATWFFGKSLTYAELDEQVRRAAAGLRAFGVRPGDRVALAMPNCPQHVIAFYAVLKLGAAVAEHNPLYTAHELRKPFQNHEARVAIVWDKTAATFEKLRGETELETIVSVNLIDAMPRVKQWGLRLPIPKIREAREQLHAPAPNTVPFDALLSDAIGGSGEELSSEKSVTPKTPAVILYTSGTTGAPKGAVLSHGNLFANIHQGVAWVEGLGKREERLLAALPFFHAYGMTMAMTLSFYVGGEMVIVPVPKTPLILDALKQREPTWFSGVPLLFEKTLAAVDEDQKASLKSVLSAFCGAATMPPEMVARWEEHTSGMFVEGYGLTETAPILIGTPMNDKRRPGYIGVPFPDTEIRIANPENPEETMPDGEEGEILAKGPQVFSGYLNNPEATEKAFHDGWFRTGDIGVMDEGGFVKLVARLKEVIITGGFNVYPAEVEAAMRDHRDVEAVSVLGLERKDGSEDVVACVVLRDGAVLDPEGLKEHARKHLTRYKVPRRFYHFEELPQNMMGKVNRREVQEKLEEMIEKDQDAGSR
ncbi:long-chain fatty acid--CoA ligase [Corynebacterium yudongzhengii]|uniref:Long-chain fatty acid--CoA ligase n=1 Tax=Corynebacterium yudongzhengii TaxID=2080740 RepID=A0A2U1T9W9_9CORY|nr:long-chain-fatty-acid--CoA ligase [Corynebacterium yudongzhengii]AWB81149.1 long-chain fatty acid--CoA ligase [Corynebacterium yudongzhengii]PWC02688.1 long-chain fatty acid--CoA ligase [Corynebacterium yudongzhengii]